MATALLVASGPWQKGLFVSRGSRVHSDVSPVFPTTNRADHGAPGPRSAAQAPSSRSGGRSAPPPGPRARPLRHPDHDAEPFLAPRNAFSDAHSVRSVGSVVD